MKPILVTGATGFLGKHLVAQLRRLDRSVPLRLLCRGSAPWSGEPDIEVVNGDITAAGDVRRVMEGAGQVYHLAGMVTRDPQDKRAYRVHVDGMRNVCEAALQHRPEKIVVVSSSGAIAVSREPVIHDENAGYKHDVVGEWPYYLSKIFAEKLAFSYVKEYGLPIVVVNPSLLLGPGDERGSSSGDVALFLEGQILTIPLGGLNFVDVRDAAAGLIGAMRSGVLGERYLLGGTICSFRKLIEEVSKISGVRAPKLSLPLDLSLAGAQLLRPLYRALGKRFRLDDASIKMSALFWFCNSDKARVQLGFATRDPLETLRETVEDVRRRLGQPAKSPSE